MAEIHVEPKGRGMGWIWIVIALIIIAALIWYFVLGAPGTQNAPGSNTMPTTGEAGAVGHTLALVRAYSAPLLGA